MMQNDGGEFKSEVIKTKARFRKARKDMIACAQDELQMHIEKAHDNKYPDFINNLQNHEEWDGFLDMMEHNHMSAMGDTEDQDWKVIMNMYMWDQYVKSVLFRYIAALEETIDQGEWNEDLDDKHMNDED